MDFVKGLKDGIPISLGYLAVSMGFGIMAFSNGLSPLEAAAISATNLTSAGQAAGVGIIAAGGSLIEMVLTQIVINLRYSLMAISLSQKLDEGKFNTLHRLIAAFGITDEIFAVSYSREEKVTPIYMYGLIAISFVGWVLGTWIGAAAGQILPQAVTNAMGIALYGMFLAIVIPPARKSKGVLVAALMAAALSIVFFYLVKVISSGFSVIICSVIAAVIAAVLFPVPEEEEGGQ